MSARMTLLKIIKHYQLDFRFPKWREAYFLIKQGIYDDPFCEILISEAEADAEQVEKLGNFLWRPPEPEELHAEGEPDIELGGTIEADCRVGIRYKDRPRNIVIYGSMGSGKTVTSRGLILGIDFQNSHDPDGLTHLILNDLKPDNQDLPQRLQGEVLVLSLTDNLRMGLNGPPNVPPYVWIGHRSLSLATRLGLVVARTCLAGVITRLLLSLNPGLATGDLTDSTIMRHLTWPPLEMVLDALRNKKILDAYSAKAGYGHTLIQMISGLLQDSGKLFDCSNGLDISKEIFDKKQHCLLNTSNTLAYVVHLPNDYFIDYIHMSRAFANYKCDHTDVIYVYDESDILMESDWEEAFQHSLSPLNRLNRLGREAGLMSVISVSAPQAASRHIRRSAHYTIAFNLSDAESVRTAIHDMQLDPRCSRMLSSLPPGQCIFRQTQSSWSNAFWCEMDFVQPARAIGRPAYAKHHHTPSVKLADCYEVLADLDALAGEHDKMQERQVINQPKCQKQAMELLKLAVEQPNMPVARLMEKIGKIAPKIQIAMRTLLEDQGYAEFEEPRVGRKNMLLIEVTNEGYAALGVPIPQGKKGRGGITHRYYARAIQTHYRKLGHEAILEWVVPGTKHPVDVGANVNGHWEAIEILVTSDKNLISHIEACFEKASVVAKLVVIAGTRKELTALQKTLSSSNAYVTHSDKIVFDVIQNYL